MKDLITDIDTKCYTRSCYKVEIYCNGNATCSKKLNYCPKNVHTISFDFNHLADLGQRSGH